MRYRLIVNDLGEYGIYDSVHQNRLRVAIGRHSWKEWFLNKKEVLEKIASLHADIEKARKRSEWHIVEGSK